MKVSHRLLITLRRTYWFGGRASPFSPPLQGNFLDYGFFCFQSFVDLTFTSKKFHKLGKYGRFGCYIYRIKSDFFSETNNTEKNGFVTATKLGTTKILFVSATKNFAAATKRFVDRTKHFVVVTKYFCYPYFKK